MENFKSSGIFTKQAHVKIPDGLYEEEHARKGFFGKVSQLYHTTPPTSWTNIEGNLKPRCLAPIFNKMDLDNQFIPYLYNNDFSLNFGKFTKTNPNFFRNSDSDEMLFLHRGKARVETTFGHLEFKKGDYIIMPRGTTYKIFIEEECKILKIEANSEFEQPSRGLLGPNALYDQTAIRIPEAALGSEQDKKEYKVEIKRDGEITTVTYPHNPLSVKGWKGSLYPWAISIYDFCPITSHRYHMPPSAHTTFLARNLVICSFVARPLESAKEEVLKVPFFHSNIDFDEVLFYHEGNFFSRDNIDAGALTFHPQGIHHGPHPKAFKSVNDKEFTDEFAVMIDARNPLKMSEAFQNIEIKDYWKVWIAEY